MDHSVECWFPFSLSTHTHTNKGKLGLKKGKKLGKSVFRGRSGRPFRERRRFTHEGEQTRKPREPKKCVGFSFSEREREKKIGEKRVEGPQNGRVHRQPWRTWAFKGRLISSPYKASKRLCPTGRPAIYLHTNTQQVCKWARPKVDAEIR